MKLLKHVPPLKGKDTNFLSSFKRSCLLRSGKKVTIEKEICVLNPLMKLRSLEWRGRKAAQIEEKNFGLVAPVSRFVDFYTLFILQIGG